MLCDLGFHRKLDTLSIETLFMLACDDARLDVALQVVVNGSYFEFFLKFRDVLISNPNLVEQYNRLKKDCEGMDEEDYRLKKSKYALIKAY